MLLLFMCNTYILYLSTRSERHIFTLTMSDAWSDIQALKNKQSNLREKLAQRKKQRQEVVAEIIGKPPLTVIKSGRYDFTIRYHL